MQTVSRAVKEDLETPVEYEVSFIRNHKGRVITDRRFNTASLMALYLGKDAIDARKMTWNPDDPNTLVMNLPGIPNTSVQVHRSLPVLQMHAMCLQASTCVLLEAACQRKLYGLLFILTKVSYGLKRLRAQMRNNSSLQVAPDKQ